MCACVPTKKFSPKSYTLKVDFMHIDIITFNIEYNP